MGHSEVHSQRKAGCNQDFRECPLLELLDDVAPGEASYAPIVRESFAAHGFSLDKISLAHNSLVNPFPVRPEEKTGTERGILKYILREKPDAIRIFANVRYLSFWTTLLLARLHGIHLYAHGVGFFKRRRIGLIRRLMMSVVLRLVTSYIAYAPIVREST